MSRRQTKVRISGLGYVGAAGNCVAELQAGLRSGCSAIRPLTPERRPHPQLQLAALLATDWDWRTTEIARSLDSAKMALAEKLLRGENSPLQADALAVLEATAEKTFVPERLGLVVGGSNLAHPMLVTELLRYQRNPAYVNPRLAFQALDTHVAATLAALVNAQGPVLNVAAAAASAAVAVVSGLDLIRAGRCDHCLVVGAMQRLSPLDWQALAALGALNTSTVPSLPFFSDGGGFTPGEGAVCILLERVDDDSEYGYAELVGGAFVSAANPLPDASSSHEIRAMKLALVDAQMMTDVPDLIVAHATGTAQGDKAELAAIAAVCANGRQPPWLSTPKAVTGHCLGASGGVGLLAALLMLQEQCVYPVSTAATDARLPPTGRFAFGQAIAAPLATVMVNAFGFGGFNAALMVRKLPANTDNAGRL